MDVGRYITYVGWMDGWMDEEKSDGWDRGCWIYISALEKISPAFETPRPNGLKFASNAFSFVFATSKLCRPF